jgi:hypothetical protein
VLLACLVCTLTTTTARADGLEGYTGFTRPGSPAAKKTNVRAVSVSKDPKPLGGSILYMVYDRGDGKEGDIFGTGIKDFDEKFMTGVKSPKFDKSARYLYLYQVVNDHPDSQNESGIQQVNIRLLVDPQYITSWGAMGKAPPDPKKPHVGGEGVGFTSLFIDPKDKSQKVIPVSTHHKIAPSVKYQDPAPPVPVKDGFGHGPISLNVRPVDASEGDLGKIPDVSLEMAANFEGAPRPDLSEITKKALDTGRVSLDDSYRGRLGTPMFAASSDRSYPGVSGFGPGLYGPNVYAPERRTYPLLAAAYDDDYHQRRDRYPAIRASFSTPLLYRSRSTLFGFTSNLGPTYEVGRVLGNPLGVGFVADNTADERKPTLAVDGEVPTPVAFGQETGGAAASGFVGGLLSPQGGFGGGGTGTTGGGAGGIGAAPNSGGGGSGGGQSGGGGTQGQTPTQTQGQTPTTTTTTNSTPPNVSVTTGNISNTNQQQQQQKQQQQQQQQQKQKQKQQQQQSQMCNCHQNNIVPAPPALLLGLLGSPLFFLALRRRNGKETKGDAA